MNQNSSLIDRRVVLKFDASMPFEALILQRLSQVTKSRHQEWLRGLLVRGFLSECDNLRTLQRSFETTHDVPPTANEGVAPRPTESRNSIVIGERATAPPAETDVRESPSAGGNVSFAALRNVIG
jgi:hypothetical protein